ncbi:MAG: helix-turn-helix transcriptional regulator [Lachnospiraceae bacterium]|nr:helix-turn-helix transcriptional regulator [Lachnospiraceae bacterium]
MSVKKKQEIEFRYYEIPQGEQVLALLGKDWNRPYGQDADKQHFHNLLEIGYCIEGDGEMVFDEKIVPYQPGMLTIIPKNFPHTTNSRLNTNSYWEYIFLNPEDILKDLYPDNRLFAQKITELVNKKEQYYMEGENEELVVLVRMIMEECRNRKSYSVECIRGLLLSALMNIARHDTESGNRLERLQLKGGVHQISAALEYIEKKYMEEMKMEDLAEICSLSETHFRRLFTEYMNMTPVEYLNLIRVQQACELMMKSRYTMEEVAHHVGYTTISTFNRNFRKIIGTSPYQYKKSSGNYQSKLLNARVLTRKGW